ncbi:hypothetical protein JHK87_048534 [Glycine soja]|nr:hypothetical protein JHK87_048534 [Glycine soja]
MLLEFQHSEPPLLNWGRKRKRSAVQDCFSPSLVFLQNHSRHTRTVMKKVLLKTENASSPDTPLSFHPDENPNLSIKQQSPKKLINGQKSEPTLEFGGSMLQSVHVNGSVNPSGSKAQNEKLLMMPFQNQISGATQSERFLVSGHPTTSLQVPSTSSNGLGHEAHLAHPGLNTNPVEFTQINSSQSQPLDEATANRELNRALAAEARRRRILIFRLKYSQKSRNDYR